MARITTPRVTPWVSCVMRNAIGLALVNAPSATRIGFPWLRHGRDFGFVELQLTHEHTNVRFHLDDKDDNARVCG